MCGVIGEVFADTLRAAADIAVQLVNMPRKFCLGDVYSLDDCGIKEPAHTLISTREGHAKTGSAMSAARRLAVMWSNGSGVIDLVPGVALPLWKSVCVRVLIPQSSIE